MTHRSRSQPREDAEASRTGSRNRTEAPGVARDVDPVAALRRALEAGPVEPGDVALVAVSGGRDSVALLHLLRFALPDAGLELRAAHLDHGMRPGSGADARWVRGLCRAWGVPLADGRLEPPPSGEADARDRRYGFLEEAAAAVEAETGRTPWVLTAHHRDDQAETVLFRAVRGTGTRGLRGIAPRRGRVLRPLLRVGRDDLARYAADQGVPYREDPTNTDLSFARNRIRHRVLPELEAARPGAALSLARLADRARAAERAWSGIAAEAETAARVEETDGSTVLARPVLRAYHPEVQARVLRRILRRYGSALDRAGTQAALQFISTGSSGGEIHLPGGLRLEREFDRIRIRHADDDAPGDAPVVVREPGPGHATALIGGHPVIVRWGRPAPAGGVSLEDARFPLTVRGWEPGDRIRFQYGSKKLAKLFAERRIGRRDRHRVPVVVDPDGRVLWVVGLARAHGVSEDGDGFGITVEDDSGQR